MRIDYVLDREIVISAEFFWIDDFVAAHSSGAIGDDSCLIAENR
jgi:hypothetical protein